MEDTQHSANLALAAYAETFLSGRRVVVFGDCTSGLAELLLERGARLVHVYDTDVGRVARATSVGTHANISVAPLAPAGLPVRDGAFDVGLVTNVAQHAQPRDIVNRLRRALSARGVGFLAIPNADQDPAFDVKPQAQGLTYYELYDLACSEFDEVRTLGQTPFVGYALADFGPDREEAFSIDTAMVPGGAEEPEWFIAIVSHFPIHCDPFSVIQFPARQVLGQTSRSLVAPGPDAKELARELEELRRKEAPLERTRELLVQARQELDKRDAWVSELEERRAAAEAARAQADTESQELQQRLTDAAAQLVEAKAEFAHATTQLNEATAALAQTKSDQAQLTQEVSNLRAQLTQATSQLKEAQARERGLSENQAEIAKLLRDAERRSGEVEKLSQELASVRQEYEVALKAQQEQEQENAAQELVLVERAQALRKLGLDLQQSDTFAAQLLRELEDARERALNTTASPEVPPLASAPDLNTEAVTIPMPSPRERALADELAAAREQMAALQDQFDQLMKLDARHTADLTAAEWTIQELEGRLLESLPSTRLAAELEQARADLQRQATLLAQTRVATLD
jgi:hypothetical protein